MGRQSAQFAIINFYGHQVVLHLSPGDLPEKLYMYPRHFGMILEHEGDYLSLHKRAKDKGCEFFKDDFRRYVGKDEEHRSFFLVDPSQNLIEFKWYKNTSQIF